jgi:fumarylpyruvate hydrolase
LPLTYLFTPAAQPALEIAGTAETFPVRRIYCVGRNYAAHAAEMGHDSSREEPFFFQKNPDSMTHAEALAFPRATREVHPEVEMIVALGKGGSDLSSQDARDAIFGYAVGLDMTRRDHQQQAKLSGRPWEVGKSFENSAPCGPLHAATDVGHLRDGAIWLEVNGERRQNSLLSLMLWSPEAVIMRLSTLFTLAPGDIIMTGTPEGVSAVQKGDVLRCGVDGLGVHQVSLV